MMKSLCGVNSLLCVNSFQKLLYTLSSVNNFQNYIINNDLHYFHNLYSVKYFVKCYNIDNKYFLTCWKSKSIFNYNLENENYLENKIFSLYYSIYENNILKIDNLSVNDNNYIKIILTKEESNLVNKYLIKYIDNVAKSNNISKIIIDIDNNLERFNLELKDGEFIVTNNRSYDNPFWFKAEKII